jgi:dihydroorotate dehydrogenase
MASSFRMLRQAPRSAALPLFTLPRQLTRSLPPKRYVSSTSASPDKTRSGRLTKLAICLGLGSSISWYYMTDTRSGIHRWLVPRAQRLLYPDAETAHNYSVREMKSTYSSGLYPRERNSDKLDAALEVKVWEHTLSNPIAISAGLDKKGEIIDPLFVLGPAIVEIGGATPLPQSGNPGARFWRLPSLNGFINRFGLNNEGADVMAGRLRDRVLAFAKAAGGLSETDVLDGKADVPPGSLIKGKLLAVQIAKGKGTPKDDVDAVVKDYTCCVSKLAPYADILVVNVSCPNDRSLRGLQAMEPLTRILTATVAEAHNTQRATKPKVMVKISPDQDSDAQIEGIVHSVTNSGVDGIIVGNSTIRRTGIVPADLKLPETEAQVWEKEWGGYSGPQMFDRTLDLVKRYRQKLDKEGADKVIFATGGICNGKQALEVMRAGASVAMIYTSMINGGLGTVTAIKRQMNRELKRSKRQPSRQPSQSKEDVKETLTEGKKDLQLHRESVVGNVWTNDEAVWRGYQT